MLKVIIWLLSVEYARLERRVDDQSAINSDIVAECIYMLQDL